MECCEPNHKIVPCCRCGVALHTCEKEFAFDGNYLCPVPWHNDGGELSDGRWACADCWDEVVKEFDEE